MKMNSMICVIILLSFSTAGCSNNQYDHKAAKNGVLVLESSPQLQQKGCYKLIVWDDAAEVFYRDGNPIPDRYCKIDPGRKAIPLYEKARRERGLPPGSYEGMERKIRELRKQIEEREKQFEE